MLEVKDILNKIICADSLEIMRQLPDKCIDLILCDPPYGVGMEYDQFIDNKENLKKLVDDFMPEVLRIGKIVFITPGNGNQHLYPVPSWTLAWVYRGGANQCSWGFNTWQPILAYGKCPYRANSMGARADTIWQEETPKANGHPCPKPITFWSKLLQRGSVKETDIIFDPFNGSGTTCVAAKQLGRSFIGIDLSPMYCKIAEARLRHINPLL